VIARLQFWLQGWPNKRRPRAAKVLGNLISDASYYASFQWCEISHQEAYHLHRLADRLVTPERFGPRYGWGYPMTGAVIERTLPEAINYAGTSESYWRRQSKEG
jgi:hypothetical protein